MMIIFDSPLPYRNNLIIVVHGVGGSHARSGCSIVPHGFYELSFYFAESFKSKENCFEFQNFHMHFILSGSNASPASELLEEPLQHSGELFGERTLLIFPFLAGI